MCQIQVQQFKVFIRVHPQEQYIAHHSYVKSTTPTNQSTAPAINPAIHPSSELSLPSKFTMVISRSTGRNIQYITATMSLKKRSLFCSSSGLSADLDKSNAKSIAKTTRNRRDNIPNIIITAANQKSI